MWLGVLAFKRPQPTGVGADHMGERATDGIWSKFPSTGISPEPIDFFGFLFLPGMRAMERDEPSPVVPLRRPTAHETGEVEDNELRLGA